MAKNSRKAAAGAAMTAVFLAVAQPAASAQCATAEPPVSTSRVRSSNPMIATLIRDAIAWSQTFRRLAQTIDASDGLVYVESGECRNYLEACLVSVTVSGPYRVLQVRVHSRTADRHLMASIGHELQHAVEVLSSAAVKDNAAMHMFYAREGRRGSQGFETDAAIEAGDAVRAEVRRYAPLSEAR